MTKKPVYTKEFDYMNAFERWFISEALPHSDSLTHKERADLFCGGPLNITMQINGVDVNPMNAINTLEETQNNATKRAEELANKIASSLLLKFVSKMEDSIESAINSAWEEFSNKELTGE